MVWMCKCLSWRSIQSDGKEVDRWDLCYFKMDTELLIVLSYIVFDHRASKASFLLTRRARTNRYLSTDQVGFNNPNSPSGFNDEPPKRQHVRSLRIER